VWFDPDVLRLNYDGRGNYLGEFYNGDAILVIAMNGTYYTTSFDLTNHFEKEIFAIQKFDADKIWSVALYDADQKFYYLKRFRFELSQKAQSFIGDNPKSTLTTISDADYPRFELVFGGSDSHRGTLEIDAESFIGVKSVKARGKRLTTFAIKTIKELEPLRFAELEEEDLPEENGEYENENYEDFENGENGENDNAENYSDEKPPTEIIFEVSRNDSELSDEIAKNNASDAEEDGQMSLF
jgi:topoisomerase-4 subunit A